MTHIVNWGCVQVQFDRQLPVLNPDLRVCASKVATYTALAAAKVPCPEWTHGILSAIDWNVPYLGRRDGLSGGRGITIYAAHAAPTHAHDFYTKLIDCRREYRVHVFDSRVIAVQKKLLRNATSVIHNHANGVTFQWVGPEAATIQEDDRHDLCQMAKDAVAVVGLDFGAVDIIQERETDAFYVLEVNSAPGIRTDQVYTAYREAFRSYVVDEHKGAL